MPTADIDTESIEWEKVDFKPTVHYGKFKNNSQLSYELKNNIEQATIANAESSFRWHLGASQIGEACSRKLWYAFRWAGKPVFSDQANHARMLRLFERGHLEEPRFIKLLKQIGAKVSTGSGDGKQHRITGHKGHFGGSLDGLCMLPGSDEVFLLEFKTHGTGSTFQKLMKEGVASVKEQHFAQMSVYGAAYGLKRALYFSVCKNDDFIHYEAVNLDWKLAEQMREKAAKIIDSILPPPRISDNRTYHVCSYCDFKEQCHYEKPLLVNCRTCKFSTPVEGGEWHCSNFNNIIPQDFVPTGCQSFSAIK